FQDIHVMIFIGFGYLMIFLKKYGYSSIGFNFLLGALCLQWSILCQGFFQLNDDYKIEIGLMSLYRADIATAAVLISMGVVLGRTSYTQLIMMGILQIVAYAVNNNLNELFFKGVDVGGSVLVHCFGAYFGLAVSYILNRNQNTSDNSWQSGINTGSYHSNLLAMIGTIFLWLYWPSFNSIDLENDKAYRAIINTYLALTSSCLTTFIASQLSFKERKFDMVHVQNSTLAGGVAIGASANLMVEPFGAILIGCLSGALSVVGYSIISPFIEKRFKILDTCGVHNLHGMPGLLGGVISVIMAAIANENHYGQTLYQIYPARASPVVSINPEYIPLEAGDGRSAPEQAAYQVVMILVTLSIAILSGLLTGFIIKRHFWNKLSPEAFYDDSMFWTMTEEVEQVQYLQDIKVPDKIFHVPNVKAALTRVSSLGKKKAQLFIVAHSPFSGSCHKNEKNIIQLYSNSMDNFK
ncbi:hypothetical protein GWI33_012169, partial [Rhynchophorus ferrugineus]